MLIVKTDFVGKYAVGGTNFDAIDKYITRYEEKFLMELLGVELFKLFKAAHTIDSTLVAYPIYKVIYDPITEDDTNCNKIRVSRGMKQMLLGMVFFEFMRDTMVKMTNAGPKKDKAEVSEDVSTDFLYQRYNESIEDQNTIQWYIGEHSEDYPTYNGIKKGIAHWAL